MKPKIAKVGVEGSNPFARSNFPRNLRPSLGGVSSLLARTHQNGNQKSKTVP
jgi:hypothetical protein